MFFVFFLFHGCSKAVRLSVSQRLEEYIQLVVLKLFTSRVHYRPVWLDKGFRLSELERKSEIAFLTEDI